jgi:hypothetical protein
MLGCLGKVPPDRSQGHVTDYIIQHSLLGAMPTWQITAPLTISLTFHLCSDFNRSIWNPLLCILHFPLTKTHRHRQDIVLVNQRTLINPISLLKNHIWVNTVSNNQYIFSFTSPDGHLPLSKFLFLQHCNDIWRALGYPHTTGHCFRIGGTTRTCIP